MVDMQNEQILRIGVIRAGKIIEEKLIRKRTTVTVGTGPRNTLVLPTTDAPKSYPLFECKGNEYYLSFTDNMTGRISVGDKAADLQSIKGQNLVRKTGSNYHLKLSDASRGRVSIGEFILLFQFVKLPPEPARPQLPQIVKGYWVRNIDWPYTTSFGTTFVCMLVIWIWAANVPLPKEPTIEDIPDRFAKMIMPDKEMSKPEEDGDGAGKQADEPKKKKKEKKVEETAGDGEGEGKEAKAATAAVRRANMEKKVSGRGLLKVLGTKGPGGIARGGAVADVFGDGSIDGTGEGSFSGIGGLDVATAAGQTGQRGVDGAGSTAEIGDMGTRGVVGGAGAGTKHKSEARVVARVTSAALQEFDSDSRSQQDIVKAIRRRIGGIKHCYEKRLKRDPDLKGKIVVRFVIHSGGKVVEVEIVENTTGDSELGACIASRVKAIRFPATEGSETSVTYPFILAPGG
jgi:outer membrane biosynthesis protein TonB